MQYVSPNPPMPLTTAQLADFLVNPGKIAAEIAMLEKVRNEAREAVIAASTEHEKVKTERAAADQARAATDKALEIARGERARAVEFKQAADIQVAQAKALEQANGERASEVDAKAASIAAREQAFAEQLAKFKTMLGEK